MKSPVCAPGPPSTQQVTCVAVQAASWLSWEHAVSSSRTSSLQFWSGSQWQQSDFPSPDKQRWSLPLATNPTPPTRDAAPPAAPHKQATGSAGPSNGAGAQKGSSAEDAAQPASMSAFTAQAMLECHYSQTGAFLQEPLLQVLARMSPALCVLWPSQAASCACIKVGFRRWKLIWQDMLSQSVQLCLRNVLNCFTGHRQGQADPVHSCARQT